VDEKAQEAPRRKSCEESDYIDYNVSGLDVNVRRRGGEYTNAARLASFNVISVLLLPTGGRM
jgi:hypothetical protein